MTHCPHRAVPLRILVAAVVAIIGWQFALEIRDDGMLVDPTARESTALHFVSQAFPTGEASVVTGRPAGGS